MILLWTPLLPEVKGQTNDADASEKFVCPNAAGGGGALDRSITWAASIITAALTPLPPFVKSLYANKYQTTCY